VAAGALLSLPGRAWLSPRLGQLMLGGLGLFLAAMAGLQARPGAGFWSGHPYMFMFMDEPPRPMLWWTATHQFHTSPCTGPATKAMR